MEGDSLLEAPADDGLEELLPGVLEHVEGRGVEEHLEDSRRMGEAEMQKEQISFGSMFGGRGALWAAILC